MKRKLSQSIFKKVMSFTLALFMLVYFIPDINFMVHATDFPAQTVTGTVWQTATYTFFGESSANLDNGDNGFMMIFNDPDTVHSTADQKQHIYLGDTNDEDYVGSYPCCGNSSKLRFVSDVTGTYTFTILLSGDWGGTWTDYSVQITFNSAPATYAVTYNKNGGDTEASPTTKAGITSSGNVGTLPTAPTRAGYVFAGWNTAANGSGTAFTAATAVSSNITVYAQWTACTTETFESFSKGATTFASGGINFSLLPSSGFSVDSLSGYGYNSSSFYIDNYLDSSASRNSSPYKLKADSPFYIKSLYLYPSSRNDGGTNQTSSVNVAIKGRLSGSDVFQYTPDSALFSSASYTDATNRGFTLIDFSVPGYENSLIDELDITVAGTTYYFAIDNFSFVKSSTYTVTYDKNGGDTEASPAAKTGIASGRNVGTLPTEPTRTGFSFAGWNTAANGSGTAFTAATAVSSDITVYAQWTPLANASISKATAAYDLYYMAADHTAPSVVLSPGGYTLNAVKNGSTTLLLGTDYTVSGNIYTFPMSYLDNFASGSTQTITFDMSGGTDPMLAISITDTAPADTTAPAVSSVSVPANGTYKTGDTLAFTVNFSEKVNAVTTGGTPRIAINIGGTVRYATYTSGTGSTALLFEYTVLSGDNDTDGIAVVTPLDLNGGTIKDAAGNDAVLTLNNVSSAAGVKVDTTAPTVSSVSVPADGIYKASSTFAFTVNFSENVNVAIAGGTPRIAINIGGTVRYATYTSGTGTTALLFRYTVQNGDNDADGITVLTPLDLNGGTIKDAANNNAVLTLNSVGSTTGVKVDTIPPSSPSIPDLIDSSDTGSSSTDNLTKDDTPTFTGTAEAGSTVKLYNGVAKIGETTADVSGNWTITSDKLSEGLHFITAKETDAAGNDSGASSAIIITIDTTPAAIDMHATSVANVSGYDIYTTSVRPEFTEGTAELSNGTSQGIFPSNTIISADGTYILRVIDDAGNANLVYFKIITKVTISGTVTKGGAGVEGVTLSYIDGTAKAVTTDADGKYTFDVPYNWSGTVTPSLTGYTFSQASIPYSNLKANATGDYTCSTTPGAPQILTVTPGNGQAEVTFDPPADNGGSEITLYTVTASPGGQTATGASTTLTITGLTNGISYTFTVTATNAIGTGSHSSPSDTVKIGRTGKIITSTSVGTLSGGNIINVPYGTKVSDFKAGLTVSDGAAKEIITGTGGSAVSNQGTTDVTSLMKIKVTAENGDNAEYSITVNSIATYTITFKYQDGITADTIVTPNVGTTYSNLPTPTRTGYTFEGWYNNASGTGARVTSVTTTATLYANWVPISNPTPHPSNPITPTTPTTTPITITVVETPQGITNPALIEVKPEGDAFDQSVEVRLKDDPIAKQAVSDALKEKLGNAAANATVFPLDISLYIKGTDTKVQPNAGTSVEITCPIPTELLANKDNIVIACVIDGKLQVLPSKIILKDGVYCVVFTATHFSPYAFVVDKDGKLSASLAAGASIADNATPIKAESGLPYAIVLTVLAIGMVVYKKKKASN